MSTGAGSTQNRRDGRFSPPGATIRAVEDQLTGRDLNRHGAGRMPPGATAHRFTQTAQQGVGRSDMIAYSGFGGRRDLRAFQRLESLVLRETDPDTWNRIVLAEALGMLKRLEAAEDGDSDEHTSALVDMYRLAYRARVWRLPKEYFFWLLVARLHVEAHVAPDALLEQEEYLGPLWRRLEAIRARHGWPDKDNGGDEWDPEEHLDQLPEDYVA